MPATDPPGPQGNFLRLENGEKGFVSRSVRSKRQPPQDGSHCPPKRAGCKGRGLVSSSWAAAPEDASIPAAQTCMPPNAGAGPLGRARPLAVPSALPSPKEGITSGASCRDLPWPEGRASPGPWSPSTAALASAGRWTGIRSPCGAHAFSWAEGCSSPFCTACG